MRISITVLSLLLALPAAAQNFVYPRPDPSKIAAHRNLSYRDGVTFDLYRPVSPEVVPLVIFVSSTSGPYPTWPIYIGWAEAAAGAGIGAVVYQSNGHEAIQYFDSLMDALRKRADELKIDPSRVVLWSGSTNVTLGLPLAMDRKRDYIRGAAVFYGYAPQLAEIRTDMPVLYVRSGLDSTGLNNEFNAIAARALAANAPWTIENYAAGLHGFEVLNDNDVSREVIARTLSFIKSVTTPNIARAYAALGDDASLGASFAREEWPAVIDGYRKRAAANPRDGESHRRLGIALLATGRHADALAAFEQAFRNGRGGARDTGYPAAKAAAGAGNVERTVHWLDFILSGPFGPELAEVRTSESFVRVRNEPAVIDLLAGIEEQRRIMAMIDSGQSADAVQAITTSPSVRFRREAVLTSLGYRLLGKGNHAEAIAILKLNTDRNPESANAWDSLAEAAEKAGSAADAIRYSRTALNRLADDRSLGENGRQQIRNAATARLEKLNVKP